MLVVAVRADLFNVEKNVKAKHDVYLLPPPSQVVTMSLGYRHAFADVLWAHVLVGQGLRIGERRRFDTLLQLYDAINALDPTFRSPYMMADALITFNIVPTGPNTTAEDRTLPYEDVVKARAIIERGARALPQDAELWLTLGQFVSFIAPASYLEDRPEEAERWRREGVAYLERAVALSGGNSNVSWAALGGASILRETGELEASVRFYERAYAVTDDEELREAISARLRSLRKRRDEEVSKLDAKRQAQLEARLRKNTVYLQRAEAFRAWMLAELPFLDAGTAQALGPPPSPAACAGPARDDPSCATSWHDWVNRFEEERSRGRRR
jgi:hypothetical protein